MAHLELEPSRPEPLAARADAGGRRDPTSRPCHRSRTLAAVTARASIVRTFGCQMNEHDSERIAGLLVAEGMEPTDELEAADVVVLNTCCIRENADNKLYGHLGRLKALKAERPDLQIAVGGCLAQKDRELIRRARRPRRRRLRHPQPRPRARRCSSGPHRGPDRRDPRGARGVSVGAARRGAIAHSAWVTIQVGCDNSCAFCIVPIVRGAEVSRRMGDIVHEVERSSADGVREITLLGQNVNSYGRDLGAGQYRPQFADLLRALDAVDGIEPHPLHLAAPEGPPPRDDRGDGRVPVGVRAPPPAAAVGERPHAGAHAPRLHRRALSRRGSRAARAAIADLAVTTDIIVGFPGETDDDFARTLEVVDAARYDAAYTFVFSPRPGTPAAEMTDDFVAPEVAQERMARLTDAGRAPRARQARGAGRAASRRCWSRGRRRRIPRCGRAAPARTSSCTSRPMPDVAVGRHRRRRGHARRAALAPRRPRATSRSPARRTACASRSPSPLRLELDPPRPRRPDRVGQVGARARRRARAGRRRDRVDRLDAGVPRPRHRHRQADRRRACGGAAPHDRRRRPARGVVGARASRPRPAPRSPTSRRAASARVARRRHRPLRAGRSSTRSRSRRRTAPFAPRSRPRSRPPTVCAPRTSELERARSRSRRHASSPGTRAGSSARSR